MERSLGLLSRTASNTPFHNDERVVLLCWPSCTEVTRHTRVVNIRKAASATKAPPFQPGCVQTRFDLRSPVGPVGSDRTGQTGEQLVRGVTQCDVAGAKGRGPDREEAGSREGGRTPFTAPSTSRGFLSSQHGTKGPSHEAASSRHVSWCGRHNEALPKHVRGARENVSLPTAKGTEGRRWN